MHFDWGDRYVFTNTVSQGTKRAVLLWLSGTRLADLSTLPVMEQFFSQSACVELEPLPITGPQTQQYQVLSGSHPARFGFFDTLAPRNYTAVAEVVPTEAAQKLLPQVLTAAGWTVQSEETSVADLLACVQRVTASTATTSAAPTFLSIRCVVESPVAPSLLTEAIRAAREWAGADGLFALLSDTQPAPVRRFVNLNNFLAEMEILERDTQSGAVDWENSFAYFVGHGQLWINQLGRDAQGTVHPQEEYAKLCKMLVEKLPTQCRDAQTGEAVIERIYRKEELYANDYLFKAPDLVVLFKPGYAPSVQSVQLGFDEDVFSDAPSGTTASAGVHPQSVSGFLLVSSPAFASGTKVAERASLTAVAPTVLHSLGIAHSAMDAAIPALFTPAYLETHPMITEDQEQELSDEEEELVVGRLRDLGYV